MSLRGGIGLPELPIKDGHEFRLGIMGGTFDPIHYGHLVTAEQARESLDLDAVLFMPAGSPAFKLDKPVTPAEDRYAMTVLATAANPAFLASRFEIDRAGVTYTADTLRALREFYPPQVKLYFITGADAIIDIVTWHNADEIAELQPLLLRRVLALTSIRPGRGLRNRGCHSTCAIFRFRRWRLARLTFASRVARGMSVRYLTSESVLGYIRKRGLYADLGQDDFD